MDNIGLTGSTGFSLSRFKVFRPWASKKPRLGRPKDRRTGQAEACATSYLNLASSKLNMAFITTVKLANFAWSRF